MYRGPVFTSILIMLASAPARAEETKLSPGAVNAAEWSAKRPAESDLSPLAVKVQVLLDRAHVSPGEIDGRLGENTEKAIVAFTAIHGLPSAKTLSAQIWDELQKGANQPVLTTYSLTQKDLDGPFLKELPPKMEELKDLKELSYTSVVEALGERFHMSPELLRALNPSSRFDKPGETINVTDVAADAIQGRVARIDVDKSLQTVRALDRDGKVLAFFPASVGSEEKPTPSGTLKVVSIQENPTYRYDPKYKFKGVSSTKPFTIRGGPNNPVGAVWIGLSKNSYGIHGTAEPSKVSKTESHGCVRLTNWDAQRLAKALKKGIEVAFVDGKQTTGN